KEHPIKQMVNMGLKVTVNDDDPQTSQITLQGEYEIANDLLDKATTRKNLLINSLEASFVSDTIKKVLLKKIHEM
ncbi:MAG: adenosine deaminase, partial [Bacillota bacterium]